MTGLLNNPLVDVVIGVILGFGLNWWTNSRAEEKHEIEARKREMQEREHVRMLLRLETTQNIKALVEFWDKVSVAGVHIPGVGTLTGIGSSPPEVEFDQIRRLALEPLPEWRDLLWRSHMGLVAKALNSAEIDRVYSLYSDLRTFTVRRAETRALLVETPEGKEASSTYDYWMRQRYQSQGSQETLQNDTLSQSLIYFNEKARPFLNDCLFIYSRQRGYLKSPLLEEDAPAQTYTKLPSA